MALQRPVSKALACNGCQQWILRSFISAVGGAPAIQHGRPSYPSRRPFSIAHGRRNEFQRNQEEEEEHPLNEINDTFDDSTANTAPNSEPEQPAKSQSQTDTLPWYLRHQPPIPQQSNPLQSRQQLPGLPEHPPPLLQPLLSHLSLELGLDDLNLLDLRSLDPPPALGANLLMVVGTARSEKHLHVSADRLCRWLRSDYGLRPHADGLLGRNELKLKLKRRAKRSKLLSAVGAKPTAQTEIDDGIRTGWVCVNVGRVEGGETTTEGEREAGREMVGFGPSEVGASVVVQLMTEEKRGEVDLEQLWEEELVRARKARERERKVESEEGSGDGEVQSVDQRVSEQSSSMSSGYHRFASVSNQSVGQAVRAYHTSTRRLQASPAVEVNYTPDLNLPLSPHPEEERQAEPTASAPKLAYMLSELAAQTRAEILQTLGPNLLAASSPLTLNQIPVPSTASAVASAVARAEPTPFLQRFYAAMPSYPSPEHWHHHIALLSLARFAGHAEAHSNVILAQLKNMSLAGLIPEERTFQLVITSVLTPLGADRRRYMSTPTSPSRPSEGKLANILSVLEDMEVHGYDPIQPAVLTPLYRACVGAESDSSSDFQAVLRRFKLARLEMLARTRDWEGFWREWRSFPARFLPRSGEVYGVLFSAIGKGWLTEVEGEAATFADRQARGSVVKGSSGKNEQSTLDMRSTIEVLRTTLEEMGDERPAIVLEKDQALAKAIMSALEFVEPELQGARAEAGGRGREWFAWYERCLSVRGRDEGGGA